MVVPVTDGMLRQGRGFHVGQHDGAEGAQYVDEVGEVVNALHFKCIRHQHQYHRRIAKM